MPTLPEWTAVERVQANPGGQVASYRPNQGPDVSAGQQAGRDLQQAASIIAESNQRQDALVAQSAANTAAQKRAALEYGDDGLRKVSGIAVTKPDFVTNYTQKWKDATQGIRDSLSSDSQKAMFDRHVEVQGLQYQSALLQHKAIETKRFNLQTIDAQFSNIGNDIARDPGSEATWRSSMLALNDALDKFAQITGMGDEEKRKELQVRVSAAAVTRILALAKGDPTTGRAPDPDEAMRQASNEVIQSLLSKDGRDMLQRELMPVVTATKAQQLAPAYDGMTLKQAQDALDADAKLPPMIKVAVRAEIEHRHHVIEASRVQEAQTVTRAAWSQLMQTGNINSVNVMADLRRVAPEEERQMRDWVDRKYRQDKAEREGLESPEEMGRYYTYFRMATESPESQAAFAKFPLEKIIPDVSKAHWGHLVQLQGAIQKGDNKAMNENAQYQQTVKMIDSVIKRAGIDTTPKEGSPQAVVYDNFKGALVMSLRQAQLAQPDKALSPDQMKKTGLSMLQERIEQGSGVGGFFQTKRLGYEIVNDPKAAGKNWIEVPYSDIPRAARDALEAELPKTPAVRGGRKPVDEALIERMYQLGKAQGRF